MESLHTKYRPSDLDLIIGQATLVNSLKELLKDKVRMPHSYLFVGNSGCGKTSTARILAKELGCSSTNIIELNAADKTGVDDMRELLDGLRYTSMGSNPIKFLIVDECHQLSKSAWNSLLKAVEEPNKHIFWAFCTTELEKVPKTIQTRCHTYTLKDVRPDDLFDLLSYVCEEEKIELPKGSLELIAKESQGSPRQALVYLSQVRGCTTKEEIAEMLHTAIDSSEVIDLCRLLISKNPSWQEALKILKNLKDMSGESVRIPVQNYFLAVILNSKSEEESFRLLRILDVFSKPCKQQTGIAEIVLGVGEIILSQE